jgi:uncharacterized protein (TIGR02001 family)
MHSRKFNSLMVAVTLAMPASVLSTAAQAEVSGNIGVVSQYIFRGGVENDGASVNGGFDWADERGFYLGYRGGALGYTDEPNANGIENNYYGGYAGTAGSLGYDIGVLYYHILNVDDADALEITGALALGQFSLSAAYLTKDVVWGNAGDIYWALGWDTELPMGFALNATAGYYTYEDSGDFIASSAKSSNFRHLDITLAHPVGETGADMHLTYTVGGKDRDDNDLDDVLVFGISYAFDI